VSAVVGVDDHRRRTVAGRPVVGHWTVAPTRLQSKEADALVDHPEHPEGGRHVARHHPGPQRGLHGVQPGQLEVPQLVDGLGLAGAEGLLDDAVDRAALAYPSSCAICS
jgi:hypothetical protein